MKYIKLFYDWPESTCTLADDEKGRLIDGMVLYARDGVVPDLPGNERFVFPVFRLQIDRDRECYTRTCKSREDYARSREDQDQEKDEDQDKEQDKEQDEYRERNNHWRTSVAARRSEAQLLVDSCISENLPCARATNLHDEFVRAMESGLSPAVILDCCRKSGETDLGYAIYVEMKQRGLNPA